MVDALTVSHSGYSCVMRTSKRISLVKEYRRSEDIRPADSLIDHKQNMCFRNSSFKNKKQKRNTLRENWFLNRVSVTLCMCRSGTSMLTDCDMLRTDVCCWKCIQNGILPCQAEGGVLWIPPTCQQDCCNLPPCPLLGQQEGHPPAGEEARVLRGRTSWDRTS